MHFSQPPWPILTRNHCHYPVSDKKSWCCFQRAVPERAVPSFHYYQHWPNAQPSHRFVLLQTWVNYQLVNYFLPMVINHWLNWQLRVGNFNYNHHYLECKTFNIKTQLPDIFSTFISLLASFHRPLSAYFHFKPLGQEPCAKKAQYAFPRCFFSLKHQLPLVSTQRPLSPFNQYEKLLTEPVFL